MLNRTRLTSAVLAVIGATAFSSVTHAASFKPTDVAADAKWVVHLDLESARSSKIATAIQERLMEREDVKKGVTEIEALTGTQIPEDLNDVTIYGHQYGEENNVVLVSGKMDKRRILGIVALSPSYKSVTRSTHEIVSWEDKGQTNFGAFHGDNRLIIARSLENVSAALDVLDAKAESLKSLSTFAGDARIDQSSAMVYVGGMDLDKLPQALAATPFMQAAKSAVVTFGEKDGSAIMKGLLNVTDAPKAEQLARAAEGLRAFATLAASQKEADRMATLAAELLQTLKIDRVDQTVTLDWKAPTSTVIELIDEAQSRKANGGPDGKGIKPRNPKPETTAQ